ncbi:putative unusual protein kinase regulating ubiquinone biosynthesis (AarF/ABC1/UbiB family) [Salsuginibacillus halophilus]|uniref:Putative unusual protein kinase regulating ubiquinone biosynthesis (AarF/ABC1/UbiB family) n=1 Tax=Salsuginibacillus halophilus TaxID=517424 RepID=A0A2P8HWL2_9BACI|nr:AarF/UbiB family protein [Salsuginibacillus halophilus]PSL50612.1 putative unusual protein kinase regulating ubiquinone biosynthesis (AarF/ABC1/UbiB family) [Salsuginibacillus halophilus]
MKYITIYRIFSIVWMSIKFFLQIFLLNRRRLSEAERQRAWEALALKQAQVYKKQALRLEGLLIKFGQFLSTRADIMPPAFLDELAELVDQVPAVAWNDCVQVMTEAWGAPPEQVLGQIGRDPVASASIGQVYRAELKSGTKVAVKVQRPRIQKIIQADFYALRIVTWLAKRFTSLNERTDLNAMYREVQEVMGDELNFVQEMKNGEAFQEKYKDHPVFVIPSYHESLTTDKVLVMEWMDGENITNTAFADEHGLDREKIAKQLLEGFLDQVLQEGIFHADPHSGNLLLQKDGRIVLLDFGMAKWIEPKQAEAIQKLVAGFVFDRYDEVVEALRLLGFLLPQADEDEVKEALERMMADFFDGGERMPVWDEQQVEAFLERIQDIARTQPIHLPVEFAFLGRAVSTFTGVIYTLHPQLDLIQAGRPVVMDWLQANVNNRSSWTDWAAYYARPLVALPGKLQGFLDEPEKLRRTYIREERRTRLQRQMLQTRGLLYAGIGTGVIFSGAGLWTEAYNAIIFGGVLTFVSLVSAGFITKRLERRMRL